jgi:hypothetical protein
VTIAAKTTGDCGRALRLDFGTVHVVVTERPPLPLHRSSGARWISPRRADVIVQKNFFPLPNLLRDRSRSSACPS